MKYIIFILLISKLAYSFLFPDNFKDQTLNPCTDKLPEPCTIIFKAVGSKDIITFKPGFYEIGVLSAYVKQKKAAQLELYYKMRNDFIVFTMDSRTNDEYKRKGLNELLRKHYIHKFINKIKLANTSIYIGSMAINYLSDYILVKNGINRLPELEKEINNILNILKVTEKEFNNKPTHEQIKLLKESKLNVDYMKWIKEQENKAKSPWAFIYETALMNKEISSEELHGSLTHLKKIEN